MKTGLWLLVLAATAEAQMGVTIRTRNGAGAATDRIQIETGVPNAAVAYRNSFLQVDAISLPPVSTAGSGRIVFDGVKFLVSEDGGAYIPLVGAGGGVTSIEGQTGPAIDLAAAGTGLSVAAAGNTITYTLADLWVNAAGDTMTGTLGLPSGGLTIGGQALHISDGNVPNAGSNLVHWNNLVGVPAGFADGIDDTGGGGGGGNADTLDGLDSLQFLRSDASDSYDGGTLTVGVGATFNVLGTFQIGSQALNVSDGNAPNMGSNLMHWDNLVGVPAGFADGTDAVGIASVEGQTGPAIDLAAAGTGLSVAAAGNTITYTLADLWVNAAGDTMTGTLNLPSGGLTIGGQSLQSSDGNAPNAGSNLVHWNNLVGVPAGFVDGIDDTGGGGGGGNADTLDGLDSLQFLRSDTSVSYGGGTLTVGVGATLNVVGTFQIGSQTLSASDGNAPNMGSNLVHWNNLVGVPAGFVDGIDDTGGGGGGGNADTLDGLDSLQFLRADASGSYGGGTLTVGVGATLNVLGTFQIGGQALNVSDGDAPNAGSNLIHWDNLMGVPAGFADGTDAGGIASIEGQSGPAIDLAAAGTGLSVAAAGNTITYTLADLWVNAAGDTMTGTLNLPSSGLTIGGQALQGSDGNGPNAGSNLVHWDNLVGVPAGFADGADDAGAAAASWGNFVTPVGNPTADAPGDTLWFVQGAGITIVGTDNPETITISTDLAADDGVINEEFDRVHWNELKGVPAGIADGIDDVGPAADSFKTQNAPSGTDPVATGPSDTLNWANGANIQIAGNAGTKTLSVAVAPQGAGSGLNADLLDGNDSGFYLNIGPTTQAKTGPLILTSAGTALEVDHNMQVGDNSGFGITPGADRVHARAVPGAVAVRASHENPDTFTVLSAGYGAIDKFTANSLGQIEVAIDHMGGDHIRVRNAATLRLVDSQLLLGVDAQGTAGVPAYSWNTDPNTGMYRPAADTIGFSTGGQERLTIKPGGTLGLPKLLTEPAGANGDVYYSMASHTFRGFKNGAWADLGGGGSQNLFQTINVPGGTDPVADSPTDILNLAAGAGISITGDAATDTVTVAVTQGAGSGLNADLLDGSDSGFFLNVGPTTQAKTGPLILTSAGTALEVDHNIQVSDNSGFGIAPGTDRMHVRSPASQRALFVTHETADGTTALAVGFAANEKFTVSNVGQIKVAINHMGGDHISVRSGATLRLTDDQLLMGVSAFGTAAAPAFSWDTDADTGIYRIGADTIGVATAGAERIRINPNGDARWAAGTGPIWTGGSGTSGITGTAFPDTQFLTGDWHDWYRDGNLQMRLSMTILRPDPDNAIDLGTGALRWANFYAANKFAAKPDPRDDGRFLRAFATEAPKYSIEDWGVGRLEKGEARITFQEAFGLWVSEHAHPGIQLTPYGECRGLYVAEVGPDGFVVRETAGGASDVRFAWRAMAIRKGDELTPPVADDAGVLDELARGQTDLSGAARRDWEDRYAGALRRAGIGLMIENPQLWLTPEGESLRDRLRTATRDVAETGIDSLPGLYPDAYEHTEAHGLQLRGGSR